jgi:hypothetical protein
MTDISKTLQEMAHLERSRIVATVVEALDAASEFAEEVGDRRLVANAYSIACTLRGCRIHLSAADLVAAEKLLEHGIKLVHLLSTKRPVTKVTH